MECFATLLPTVIPGIGGIADDLIHTLSSPRQPSPHADTSSGLLASAINDAAGFASSVDSKDQTGAANAAAKAALQAVATNATSLAQAALESTHARQQMLRTQLLNVCILMEPCNDAENNVFAMLQLLRGKIRLTAEDRHLLRSCWLTAHSLVHQFLGLATGAMLDTVTDVTANAAFANVVSATKNNSKYDSIKNGMKDLGAEVSPDLVANVHDLWVALRGATLVGMQTVKAFADGLQATTTTSAAQPTTRTFAAAST